jgi:protein-L-isoaspartate(D-aspartate) O-methyltransferase
VYKLFWNNYARRDRDEHVLEALAQVPREKFVDEAFEHKAWENVALPIGQGQTISQPTWWRA